MNTALIKQTATPPPPPPIHVRHPVHGHKVAPADQLAVLISEGWVRLVDPTWLYHPARGAEIFDACEEESLSADGWVDTPAKCESHGRGAISVTGSSQVGIVPEIDPTKLLQANTAALELLKNEGLSRAALMRRLGLNDKNTTERNQFKPIYEAVFEFYQGQIWRQGMSYFFTREIAASAKDQAATQAQAQTTAIQQPSCIRKDFPSEEIEMVEGEGECDGKI